MHKLKLSMKVLISSLFSINLPATFKESLGLRQNITTDKLI